MKTHDKEAKSINKHLLKINFTEGDVPSLHPHSLSSIVRGVALCKWIYEGLTRLSLEGEYELAGAEEVDVSLCGKFYTFRLRSNHYSNGEPVLAYDYERFWKEALMPDSKCPNAHLLYYIKNAEKAKRGEVSLESVGVKAVDSKTLYVELSDPCPYFLSLLSLPVFLPFKTDGKSPLFNGPYLVESWSKESQMTLKTNSHFWDYSELAIDKVKILMVQDSLTTLSFYESGEIDWLGDPFCWLPAEIVSSEISKGNLVKQKDVMYPFWLYLNTEYFPLSSPSIRKALSCVINRNEISNHIFIGDAPLLTPVPHPVFNGSSILNNDVEEGKKYFQKGLEELGLQREDFPTLKLSSSFKRLAEYLQATWQRELGLRVDVEVQEWNTFYSNIAKGDYEIGGYFISSEYNDPLSCLETLAMNNNRPRWKSDRYCEIIKRLKKEEDINRRNSLFAEAQEILKREMPVIFIVNKSQHCSFKKNLDGVCFDHQGAPDIRYAYFNQEQEVNRAFVLSDSK